MPPTIESGDPSSGGSLPAGAATSSNQTTEIARLTSILADTSAALTALANIYARQADGSQHARIDNFPATQPVSGPLTDTQLRATAVPVSGTVTATGPLTDTQLRASTVPVSGTFWPTAAASPLSSRLSDGAAFYDAAKTGQLPSALVGGRLDANTGAWLGSTAPTVGQKTMANSVPIVIASDQSAVPVSGTLTSNPSRPATATQTSVNAAVADTQLLASNANRLGAVIANNSSSSVLYVLLGSGAASATNYNYVLMPVTNGVPGVVEIPFGFTGQIRGFWNVASGTALISELTA